MMCTMTQDWERRLAAIKAEREKRGLTQTELADLAGVSEATVQNLEGVRSYTRAPHSLEAVEQAFAKLDQQTEAADSPDPEATPRPAVPLRVQHELSGGEVIDTDVIDLSRGGMKMVVVVTRDPAIGSTDEAEMRADLQEWTRVQRALRGLVDGSGDTAAG